VTAASCAAKALSGASKRIAAIAANIALFIL
jgi:hypothetical protein